MKVRGWTKEEELFLKENRADVSCKKLAEQLNRTVVTIHIKRRRMGISEGNFWTKEEDLFLRENYSNMSNIEIGHNLNREPSSVSQRMHRLGFKRSKEWTANYMRNLFIGKTNVERFGEERAKEMAIAQSIRFSGENSPNYSSKRSEETKRKMSELKIGKIPKNLKELHESIKGKGNPMYGKFGKDHPGYINGKAYEPYPETWHRGLKDSIRERDGHKCMNCGKLQENIKRALSIHHIDYNKLICIPQNLVSLCPHCHALTNTNRPHWIKFFHSLLSEKYGYEYSETGEIILNMPDLQLKKKFS